MELWIDPNSFPDTAYLWLGMFIVQYPDFLLQGSTILKSLLPGSGSTVPVKVNFFVITFEPVLRFLTNFARVINFQIHCHLKSKVSAPKSKAMK